jgi:hypothetical protein
MCKVVYTIICPDEVMILIVIIVSHSCNIPKLYVEYFGKETQFITFK